jgi:hypothetical protein
MRRWASAVVVERHAGDGAAYDGSLGGGLQRVGALSGKRALLEDPRDRMLTT